jgi:putative tryptophan/tyrosine transport system substrate-binding protein
VRRREIIEIIAGSVVGWPLVAGAQRSGMPVIGYLSSITSGGAPELLVSFREGLGEAGFVEGQNVAIEYRWAEGRYDRLPALAAELVGRRVNVIYAYATPAALAAKAATLTIPIVFSIGADPVALGLVESFNRPGGNLTGVTALLAPLHAKRLQLLHELVPDIVSIGFLGNPKNQNAKSHQEEVEAGAQTLGLKVSVLVASDADEMERAFAACREKGCGALLVADDPLFTSHANELVELAARYALPAIYDRRDYVLAGGLISYGPVLAETRRQAGSYVGRILKGEKPADLPVAQTTRFELFINLKTANALSLTIPSTVLGLADEVIE